MTDLLLPPDVLAVAYQAGGPVHALWGLLPKTRCGAVVSTPHGWTVRAVRQAHELVTCADCRDTVSAPPH